MKKDPYLSELDAMDNFEPPPPDLDAGGGEETEHEAHETDEPTSIDLKSPPLPRNAPPAPPDMRLDMGDAPPQPSETGDFPEMAEESPEGPEPVKELLDLSPDLSVPLVVVIGRKSFTVKDLLGLRIGQIMDLERNPGEPVDLVAAGKVVGKGELIEVDGKLGIRVLKLLK